MQAALYLLPLHQTFNKRSKSNANQYHNIIFFVDVNVFTTRCWSVHQRLYYYAFERIYVWVGYVREKQGVYEEKMKKESIKVKGNQYRAYEEEHRKKVWKWRKEKKS